MMRNHSDAHLPQVSTPGALTQRANPYELDTPWVPPPGNPLEHSAAGFAKILGCNVFLSGLDPDFVAENCGYFTAPYEDRRHIVDRVIDDAHQAVHVTLDNGTVRTAQRFGSQGFIALPQGHDGVFFDPSEVLPNLPDPDSTPWPMGDLVDDDVPRAVDRGKIEAALDAAFDPAEALTAAVVVTYRGQIIGERYRAGIGIRTPLESWSMGKSLSATLLGILANDGIYDVNAPAPIPEWQGRNDPRAQIRIADILHMSSGLRFRAMQDPDWDPTSGHYPDHLYVYTGGVNAFEYAASRPQQWPPNTVGRYRNCDPVLTNYLVRLAVEARGDNYHAFPQRALFDKIGIRTLTPDCDPYGNFLLQGYETGAARDWARLGNLYLQDGVWNGERILAAGWADFVSTLAPAWVADGRPVYGGLFWINGAGTYPIPTDAYYMSGAGNQKTIIIPSHDMVVVRLGHYKGAAMGDVALKRALALLIEAIA